MTWPLKGIWARIQPNNVQTQTLSAADLVEYDGIAAAPAMKKQKTIKRKQSTNKSSDSRFRTRKSSTSPSIMTKMSKEKPAAVMMGYTEPDYQVDSDDSHSQQRAMDMRAQYNQYEQGYPNRHQRMINDVGRKPH